MILIDFLLFIIFIILSVIHFNWVLGGQFGLSVALPTNSDGEMLMKPSRLATFIVGIGLLVFAFFYLLQTDYFNLNFPSWIFKYGNWIIPSIFILRAIGDFKYVGFFRKIKETEFAKWDAKLFSPLCLGIGVLGLMFVLNL